jgi:hypothetical protein
MYCSNQTALTARRALSPDRPARIHTGASGSFAHYTILNRLPAIVDRVLAAGDYPPATVAALRLLREECAAGAPVAPLRETAADRAEWDAAWERFAAGRAWVDIPWYFAEAYFHRRLLEASGYFQPGPGCGRDPYAPQKLAELDGPALQGFADALARLPAQAAERLPALLLCTLWGNRADLTFADMAQTAYAGLASDQTHNLLIDHRPAIAQSLAGGVPRVDFINDNAGLELLFDLALADFLLTEGLAGAVNFHLKPQPFFVSDAVPADVEAALSRLRTRPALAPLGRRLDEHLAAGRLRLRTAPFWVSAYGFEALPPALRGELAGAALVFIKGDANYRRLLDDRAWPVSASLAELTTYFPTNYATIRAVKAELIVDIGEETARRLKERDPNWMTSGEYGLICVVPAAA